jgi:hypothetical protein
LGVVSTSGQHDEGISVNHDHPRQKSCAGELSAFFRRRYGGDEGVGDVGLSFWVGSFMGIKRRG